MNGRHIRKLLAGSLCLLAFVAACGQDAAPGPGSLDSALLVPTPTLSRSIDSDSTVPTQVPSPPSLPTPTLLAPTPTPEVLGSLPDRIWSVSPSLDEQVFESDTIVRASLLSANAGTESIPSDPGVAPTYRAVNELRFTVHEYLKGSGPSEITVVVRDEDYYVRRGHTPTHLTQEAALSRAREQLQQRRTTWDDREGVLFLRTGEPSQSGGAQGASSQSTPALGFTQSNHYYQTPFDYSIDTLSRAWLPSSGAGASGSSGTPVQEYITDGSASPAPTISLSDLRSKITELETTLESGASIEGFRDCVYLKIIRERYGRAYGPWTPPQFQATLPSGSVAGTEIHRDNWPSYYEDPQYHRFWLSGSDMDLFQALVDDDDSDPDNGYDHTLALARPVPAGEYQVRYNMQHYRRFPCNFVPEDAYDAWTVTVTAPSGTLHEAFFDPVTVGTAVKADGTNGALKPASFTDANSASATLQSLSYEPPAGSGDGTVKLHVDPHTGLAGHSLDFIELDGSVSLSLGVADAAVDAASKTLSWSVASQPWDDGDKLMLRIRKAAPPAPQGLGVTLANGSFTITWSAVTGADQYRVGHRTGGSEGEWTDLDATTGTSQAFSPEGGVACGTTYEFRVQARGDGTTYPAAWGDPSEPASHATGACNSPPVFTSDTFTFTVREDAPVWPVVHVVGVVSATDPDEGDRVLYYITAGNEAGRFNMSSSHSGGLILVWGALDYETVTSYTLTVEARDGKVGGTSTATVNITVTDVDD